MLGDRTLLHSLKVFSGFKIIVKVNDKALVFLLPQSEDYPRKNFKFERLSEKRWYLFHHRGALRKALFYEAWRIFLINNRQRRETCENSLKSSFSTRSCVKKDKLSDGDQIRSFSGKAAITDHSACYLWYDISSSCLDNNLHPAEGSSFSIIDDTGIVMIETN